MRVLIFINIYSVIFSIILKNLFSQRNKNPYLFPLDSRNICLLNWRTKNLCRRYRFREMFVRVGTRNENPHENVKAYRVCRSSRGFIFCWRGRESAMSPWTCNVRTSVDGCIGTDDRAVNVKSAWTMQIYGVTVNTAAEHIIHSDAYLTERVHAFTLGTDDGIRTGSSAVRISRDVCGHTRARTHTLTHVRTHARVHTCMTQSSA